MNNHDDWDDFLRLATANEVAQTTSMLNRTALSLPTGPSSQEYGHADRRTLLAKADLLRARFLSSQNLGRASRRVLEGDLSQATNWAIDQWQQDKGDFVQFVQLAMRRTMRAFDESMSPSALWRELRDQEERDAAVLQGSNGCTQFLAAVDRRLHGLRHGAPNRWYVEALDPDDLHQEVAIEVLEALSQGIHGFEQYERPGKEATLILIYSVRARLLRQRQKERRWRARSIERGESASPTPEQLLIDHDRKNQIATWPRRLRALLSRPQQRWLDAFLRDAAQNGTQRWVHAATRLGRDKSSASRAVELLQSKLEVLNARELLR